MRHVFFTTAQSFWQGRRDMVKPKVLRFLIVRRRPFPTRETTLQNKTVNLFILAFSGPTKGLPWITEWDFKAWSAFDWLYVGSYLVGYDIPIYCCRGCPSQTNHNRLLALNPSLLHDCAFLAVACTPMESISTCRFGSRLPWSFLRRQVLRNKKQFCRYTSTNLSRRNLFGTW